MTLNLFADVEPSQTCREELWTGAVVLRSLAGRHGLLSARSTRFSALGAQPHIPAYSVIVFTGWPSSFR